ncbi:EAL domain-containing protein [Rhizobium sp. Leaf371]|uniref:putative bifunctional diguanylate cyclase/phosphodiesterase n=1 Tax=Rhizobium sp. Leaf371 TaxID=1736355 RepID=UPI0009EB9761|nr:EAL domain-containing protein [Rhizobium sp. Leaf371]
MALRALFSIFGVQGDDPDLVKAQYAAFSKQIPLMYFILLVNSWGLAATHIAIAPAFLTIYIPAFLTLVCAVRILYWWIEGLRPTANLDALRALRKANALSWVLAAAFAAWGLCLAPYGEMLHRSHVAFYMGITVIGCIFCLSHLLSAALAVTVIVSLAFAAYFGMTGNLVFIAMAVDLVLVSAAMIAVLSVQYRDFLALISSKRTLLALNEENKLLANQDSLTSMPNRRRFFAELESDHQADHQAGHDHNSLDRHAICVGLIDLDGFKPVNDIFGHGTGDDLLIQVADRLLRLGGSGPQGADRPAHQTFFARLGGDEFGYITRQGGLAAAVDIGAAVCAALAEPFLIADARIELSASIGIAALSPTDATVASVYERADHALYESKRQGRGEVVVFSKEHGEAFARLLTIERAFGKHNYEDEVSLVYQPIVDMASGRLVAFEALARWYSPTLGHVSPAEFIPAAERSGFINPLTRLLLRRALEDALTWPSGIRLSFNLSARDVSSGEQALRLLNIVLASGVAPQRVEFEITETAILADMGQARTVALMFKAAGVGIALDDFGTGYSSLTHLHEMPLDKLKIDRSFVNGIDSNSTGKKIVKSMLRMCADLDIGCVIEGIETRAEYETVKALGGPLAQGYFLSRPLSADKALALAAADAPLAAAPEVMLAS